MAFKLIYIYIYIYIYITYIYDIIYNIYIIYPIYTELYYRYRYILFQNEKSFMTISFAYCLSNPQNFTAISYKFNVLSIFLFSLINVYKKAL